ncbi:MAG: heavy metal translocating P-type ATPase [Planctomycetaceae bacterium]
MSNTPGSARCCDYCGLPVEADQASKATWDESIANGETSLGELAAADKHKKVIREELPVYCCYGCRFAAAITQSGGDVAQARWLMTSLGWSVFFTMNVMAFTMYLWSQPDQVLEPGQAIFYDIGRYVCLLFTTPVVLLLGMPLANDAWESLWQRRISMSLLLVVGVAAAFVYSLYSVFTNAGHVYFEVCCMVLVIVTLGRWLEAAGKIQTTQALRALEKFLPEQVRVLRQVDGRPEEQIVPRAEVQAGDMVRVLPGERIPVDGLITRHYAEIDEQAVTGEAVPAAKGPGDNVYSGTLNLDGDLTIQASSSAEEGTLQRIIAAVTQASAAKEMYQRLADRLSSWFLPLVTAIALVTLMVHWNQYGLRQGILAALSVVVISCPCALGLATPMAIWAALGRAARKHVLIREGDALSRLVKADVICFDKTGTLTSGKASVAQMKVGSGESPTELAQVTQALVQGSSHPFSKAILNYLQQGDAGEGLGEDALQVKQLRLLSGRGLLAEIEGRKATVYLGSGRMMQEYGQQNTLLPSSTTEDAMSLVYVAWEGRVRGVYFLQDEIRPEAAEATRRLKELGLTCVLLSGDRAGRANRLGDALDLEVHGELLPEEKLDYVRSLRQAGHQVIMVGDGINDAPALAAADIGISLASGTDISRETAAVCLMRDDLLTVPWLIELSKKTVRTIRWNLAWAFIYNAAGIGIAALGALNPIFAAVAMVVSSVLVVTNSLRLANESDVESPSLASDVTRLVEQEVSHGPAALPLDVVNS